MGPLRLKVNFGHGRVVPVGLRNDSDTIGIVSDALSTEWFTDPSIFRAEVVAPTGVSLTEPEFLLTHFHNRIRSLVEG